MSKYVRPVSLVISCLLITTSVTCNVLCSKVLQFDLIGSTFLVSGSVPFFIFVFVLSNILVELEGAKFAKRVTGLSFLCVFISVCMIRIVSILPGYDKEVSHQFSSLLSGSASFLIASWIAYMVSAMVQISFFNMLRRRKRISKTITYSVSMMLSQFIDVALFSCLGYYIGNEWYKLSDGAAQLFDLILGQYIVELALILISLPIYRLISYGVNKTVEVDRYLRR